MKLFIFDVDGTLVDSQSVIVASMADGFAAAGLAPLPRDQVLSIVGLSLPVAVARLLPDADGTTHDRVTEGYRQGFFARRKTEEMPLYPGAAACLDALVRDDWLLGIATGKSRRGLDALIEQQGWQGRFITTQAGDENPSKPSPQMLFQALRDTGVAAQDTAMIGDTVFDIEMGRAAGIAAFGAGWGYHPRAALEQAGAVMVAPDFAALTQALKGWADG
ncbi:HAD-IA family hydrolase [Paracoccus jiaweipingae]|uniref:HAD-IA family hydrolase n=1 Tax=unclassified Paracoccus (in: a-proteobacteria) TaxID=2688777 RepID=UPI0037BA2EEF